MTKYFNTAFYSLPAGITSLGSDHMELLGHTPDLKPVALTQQTAIHFVSSYASINALALTSWHLNPVCVPLLAHDCISHRHPGITSLGFDHMELLGHTLDLIAAEKAGIMRRDVPCFTVQQPPDAMGSLEVRGAVLGCTGHPFP
jgi:hypothetical protein